MIIDSEKLEKNAKTLLEKFSDAKTYLKKANGEKHYIEIAKDLGVNEKTVSPALSLAKGLGFAEKIKSGVYKKITAHMKYIPNPKKKEGKYSSVKSITKKFSKNKKKKNNSKKSILRFDYESKVEKMTAAYRWLFITENILRDLIRQVIGNIPNWWEDRIPDGIKKEVEKTIDNSRYDDVTKKDNLEYTHMGQLKEIITWKKNWEDFKPFLRSTDKENFEHELKKVISPRNAIGHCIPLRGDDYKYVEMRFKAILKILK